MSDSKPTHYHNEHIDSMEPMHVDDKVIRCLNTATTVKKMGSERGKRPQRRIGNPAPLGLGGFALTTFVLALVNLQTQRVSIPQLVVGPALAYGGVTQFCAGMWEMAIGNTFAATALGSYGAFWVSYSIILTPSFGVGDAYTTVEEYNHAMGFFLMGFFIFTVLLTLCTLRGTAVFCVLLCLVDVVFLLLGLANLLTNDAGEPHKQLTRAGGVFGFLASFTAWYVMLSGLTDERNSFFVAPLIHLPWGEDGRDVEDIESERGEGGN